MDPLNRAENGTLRRHFRLGCTSYTYPADVLPNVERLAGRVDDVELVFFEVEERSPLPATETIEALRELAPAHGLSFTVHLPLDLALASANPESREHSVVLAQRVIRHTSVLDPWGYVIHVEHREAQPGSWEQWQRTAGEALSRVAEAVERPERLCLENIESSPPDEVFSLADRLGLGICLDVGHLVKCGIDPAPYLDGILPRARIVHLHGWDGRKDHRSITVMPEEKLTQVIEPLYRLPYSGVVTLEVFNEKDVLSSWECVTGAKLQL